jgi:hypothetical protein
MTALRDMPGVRPGSGMEISWALVGENMKLR